MVVPVTSAVDRYGLALTTTPAVARTYRLGVDRLLVGNLSAALRDFELAKREDPQFVVGRAALTLTLFTVSSHLGRASAIRDDGRANGRATRRERQHAQILNGLVTGDSIRAAALAREHLLEFPLDLLVFLAVSSRRPADRTDLARRIAPHYGNDPTFWKVARGVTYLEFSPGGQ